ncbi:MAG: 4-alpha-glucanotransferase [Haloarculaceae archaeon]
MTFARQSGVFLHLTSLPGPHGIGDLGAGARTFLAFLDRAEQSLWQFCPLGPTVDVHDHSPYASPSAFAGNPLLIDLTALVDRGWLDGGALSDPPGDPEAVRYDAVAAFTRDRLWDAYEGFQAAADPDAREALAAFRERESAWLADYALYAALKDAHGDAPWTDWPADLRDRESAALAAARETHADRIDYHAFVQWVFDDQWTALRARAAEHGIDLMGDLPIYVAADSADVWANPDLFDLAADGTPATVAGVPPNPGDDGQRWGNPVYDWAALAARDYDWWLERIERLLALVDVARIDHFKAFDEYWAISAEAADPTAGDWQAGPGADFFEVARDRLGELPFVVEDLGFLDENLVALRDRFDFPGMRVPHYADWCAERHRHKPTCYPDGCIAYTSTHDTETAVGYYRHLDDEQRACLEYALATDAEAVAWDLLEAVWHSEATLAMTTVPDLLELGSEARLNDPGTAGDNWAWRVTADALAPGVADRLAGVTTSALR